MCYIIIMLNKYIIVDDSNNSNTKHNLRFATLAQASAYISKHNLACTHLVYDLSYAKHVIA